MPPRVSRSRWLTVIDEAAHERGLRLLADGEEIVEVALSSMKPRMNAD